MAAGDRICAASGVRPGRQARRRAGRRRALLLKAGVRAHPRQVVRVARHAASVIRRPAHSRAPAPDEHGAGAGGRPHRRRSHGHTPLHGVTRRRRRAPDRSPRVGGRRAARLHDRNRCGRHGRAAGVERRCGDVGNAQHDRAARSHAGGTSLSAAAHDAHGRDARRPHRPHAVGTHRVLRAGPHRVGGGPRRRSESRASHRPVRCGEHRTGRGAAGGLDSPQRRHFHRADLHLHPGRLHADRLVLRGRVGWPGGRALDAELPAGLRPRQRRHR